MFCAWLLNALDMQARGYDVKLVIEGSATKLIKTLMEPGATFGELYQKVKQAGLIDAVCVKPVPLKWGPCKTPKHKGCR